MLNENISAKGQVQFQLIDENGVVKAQETHNLVVNTGLAYITSRMKDVTTTAVSHMALGTGTTNAAGSQTTLVTEAGRVVLTSTTIVTTTVTNDSIQYVGTFPAGTATGAITEAGLFNAASAGTMVARTVFSVINKGALDSLVVTWKITVA